MFKVLRTAACVCSLVCFPSVALSQDSEPSPKSSSGATAPAADVPLIVPSGEEAAKEEAELAEWIEDFAAWQEWWARWANRPEPGLMTGFRGRRERPAPPVWVAERCATGLADSGLMHAACELLLDWQRDEVTNRTQRALAAARAQREERSTTTWWEHIHMDLLWPAMQWQASVYGIIGMHTSATVRGRFELFLTPGAMLLNVPTTSGSRAWKVAANYGLGYRLLDFTFPGSRPASLHVNFAKAWLLSDVSDALVGRNVDFVGFSITFKKRR